MSNAPDSTPGQPAEQTHGCVRCGRLVPLDVAMCESCNPLGLRQPASTQVHGTVAAALILAVVVLAVAGRLVLAGVGPFRAEVVAVEPVEQGLAVSLVVANDGSKAGSTTCRLTAASRRAVGSAVVQTPTVEPGSFRHFTTTTTAFGAEPLPLAVTCQDQ